MCYTVNKEVIIMAKVSTSISLDSDVKRQAQELFTDLGLDLSTAINIFLKQSIRDDGFPFEIRRETPNTVTQVAIDSALKDEDMHGPYDSVADLMEALSA